jgi:hypothetical protein
VVGAPTYMHGLSNAATRQMAARARRWGMTLAAVTKTYLPAHA